MHARKNWWLVAVFALAMAWMEAATVVYLRVLVGRLDPYQAEPLPDLDLPFWWETELVREAATLLMLGSVGWLAGRTRRSRFGFFLVGFGIWDIFYYVFLRAICGWPHTLLDWDILFLLPLPWWGPVLSPMLIALLVIIAGTLLSQFDRPETPLWPNRWAIVSNVLGTGMALYVFMAEALRALPQGEAAVRTVLPKAFHWLLFLAALALMSLPILDLSRQIMRRQGDPTARLPQPQPPGEKERQPDDRLGRRGAHDGDSG